jgi:hypothetical protein
MQHLPVDVFCNIASFGSAKENASLRQSSHRSREGVELLSRKLVLTDLSSCICYTLSPQELDAIKKKTLDMNSNKLWVLLQKSTYQCSSCDKRVKYRNEDCTCGQGNFLERKEAISRKICLDCLFQSYKHCDCCSETSEKNCRLCQGCDVLLCHACFAFGCCFCGFSDSDIDDI